MPELSDIQKELLAEANSLSMKIEGFFQKLNQQASVNEVDGRWLNIGKTHMQQGFMSVERAIIMPNKF